MTSNTEALLNAIGAREAKIGIFGLGYVGLPLLLRFAECGFTSIGFDIDPRKVEMLNGGRSYIEHVPDESVRGLRAAGRLEAVSDFDRAAECDALLLCLPTPLSRNREPDLSFVLQTVEALRPRLRAGQMLVLESTTWPGTTEEELRPVVEEQGFEIGADFFLLYSPEREDPGNAHFTTRTIPKVVGGSTEACRRVGEALYSAVVDEVVPVTSTRVAEMTKLLENIHRSVNIGLVNELKIVCDSMGIDIHEVIRAAATKPFGFTPFYPGPGLGGHCIPIDPFYLTWKAREYGLTTRFIELAGEVNMRMPAWVVNKVIEALNTRGKAVRGARILVLGIAYKKNVDDRRESPAVEIMDQLRDLGAELIYSDPHVPEFLPMRRYAFDLHSQPLTAELLEGVDCVVVATDHDAFDYELIRTMAPLVVDSRGRFLEPEDHIVKA